jgi:hypothetical protein
MARIGKILTWNTKCSTGNKSQKGGKKLATVPARLFICWFVMDILETLQSWVPTNIRTYVSSMAGSQEPISEKNFKPEELAFMRQQLQAQAAKNQKQEEYYRQVNEYATQHEGMWKGWRSDKTPEGQDMYYSKQDGLQELQSYGNRGKTSISYDAYSNESDADGIVKSFTSPGYNVMTTLGQYSGHLNPDGTTSVRDTYDWSKPEGIDDMSLAQKLATYGQVRNAREFGNLTARLLRPDLSRPVDVNLGKLSPQ